MKVVKKKSGDELVHLEATASSSEVSDALAQATMAFCSQMNLRPVQGKTPAQVASEQLGIRDLDSVVAQQAVEMLVPMALDKHNIVPAFMPDPQPQGPFSRGHAFKFAVDVMPKPAFELEDYSPVKLTMKPYETDESQIENQINEIARQCVVYVTEEPHPIHAGDSCLLKMAVSKDGEPVKSLTADSRPFTLGKGYMPPSFEEGIDGMEVGEERTFTFEGPGLDENMNEITETFEATITLLEVQKASVPVIDDAWVAKNMPMHKDLESFKAELRKNVDGEGLRRYEDMQRNMAAAELAKRFKGSIPDAIYEATMRETQTKLRQRVQQQGGMTWDQFVEQQGGEQQLGMMLMMDTRQQLVRGYALDAYYRHEKLSYTDDDLNEVCFTMNPRSPRATRERMEKSGFGYALREAAERLRACKHLVEHAEITYTEPEGK